MSETVNYKPRVTVGSTAGKAILASAGAECSISGRQFDTMLKDEWLSTCQRETALQLAMQSHLNNLMDSKIANDQNRDALQDVLQLVAMIKALDEVGNLSAMVKAENTNELAHITKQGMNFFSSLKQHTIKPSEIFNETNSLNNRLRKITSDAHQKLAQAEKKVLGEILGKTLCDCGYTVESKRGAVRATKGSTSIWMDIDQKARVVLDVSGFSGLSCQKEIKNLEQRLADQGIVLNREDCHLHGKKQGGDLAQHLSGLFNKSPSKKNNNSGPMIMPLKTQSSGRKKQKKQQTIKGGL